MVKHNIQKSSKQTLLDFYMFFILLCICILQIFVQIGEVSSFSFKFRTFLEKIDKLDRLCVISVIGKTSLNSPNFKEHVIAESLSKHIFKVFLSSILPCFIFCPFVDLFVLMCSNLLYFQNEEKKEKSSLVRSLLICNYLQYIVILEKLQLADTKKIK